MGALPPDSVPPVQVADVVRWVNEDAGLFRAASLRTVSIDDIIDAHGPRYPAYPDAPREVRGLYVVLSAEPLPDRARNAIDDDVEDFMRPGASTLRWYPNFWEATGGRVRLILDGLGDVLR